MSGQRLPKPPFGREVDVRDLDGFMLNTERLMASELVAVSSLEVIGGALLLWARAWKQMPPASLPDNDQVIASFCKLSLDRFRDLRDEVLRGFVKHADGRLYHLVLVDEVRRAFKAKVAYRAKRKKEARRLQEWRNTKKKQAVSPQIERTNETRLETQSETRFVPEGTIRDGTGQGEKVEREVSRAPRPHPKANGKEPHAPSAGAPVAQQTQEGFHQFVRAVRDTIPTGWSRTKALRMWLTLDPSIPVEHMIEAWQDYTAYIAAERKLHRGVRTRYPENWMRERVYENFLDDIRRRDSERNQRKKTELATEQAWGLIGSRIVGRLTQARFFALFSGSSYDQNTRTILARNEFQARRIEDDQAAMRVLVEVIGEFTVTSPERKASHA